MSIWWRSVYVGLVQVEASVMVLNVVCSGWELKAQEGERRSCFHKHLVSG